MVVDGQLLDGIIWGLQLEVGDLWIAEVAIASYRFRHFAATIF
jgi:hypothetical protein